MLPIALALVGLTAAPAPAVAPASRAADPPVRVWLNKRDRLDRGDRVRVYVRPDADGYLVVLHAEPNGRVRVLFPLDPADDNFVRAGRDYEIRGRGDGEAFRIWESSGSGLVYAALSRDPFQFDGLALNRHWDYRAAGFVAGDDFEADLTALAQSMAAGAWFDYDIARYDVGRYVAYGGNAYHLSFYDPYYDPYYRGHGWYGGSGFSIRVGYGWGSWYDPWWDPWYTPWYGDWWWHRPSYWSPWGPRYVGWGYPYYPGYYGPGWGYPTRYRTYVYGGGYVTRSVNDRGGLWGTYAFKSREDRYGLRPDPVGVRQRAPTARTAAFGSTSGADVGRRTVNGATAPTARGTAATPTARRPSGATAPTATPQSATTGRRAAPQRGEPQARPTPTQGSRQPASTGRRPTPQRQDPQATPRPTTDARRNAPATRETPRGLRVAPNAPEPRRSSTARQPVSGATRSTPTARPAPSRAAPTARPAPSRPTPSARPAPSRPIPSARPAPTRPAPSARPAPSRGSSRPAPSARPAPSRGTSRPAPSRPSSGPTRRRN